MQNPLMLFLHGGPGTAQIGFAPKFQSELEKHFIIVNWDQRGAGLSYSKDIKDSDLTIETMLNDTVELITYLLKRFDRQKLFLVGHSWGSILGVLASKKVPDHIFAYIGIGQVVNMMEGERISLDFTLQKANEQNHKKAVQELHQLKFEPSDFSYLNTQRKWLTKFGGSHIGVSMYDLIISNILFGTEYTMKDWFTFIKAGKFSLHSLWNEILGINFFDSVPSLEVPVYFFVGKHDYQTPFELVEKYYQKVECSHKKLIWFEQSGHLVNYEETDKFNRECIKIKDEILVH